MWKFILTLGCWFSSVQPGSAAEPALHAKTFLNQKAPTLVVEKWISPEPDLRGKFVLLDFWATWCPSCRQTIPELNRFQKKFADQLVVIGVSSQMEGLVRAQKEPRLDYSSAIDTQARTLNQLQITKIPHTLLIDPAGMVRWEGFPLADSHRLTDRTISKALADWRATHPVKTNLVGLTISGPRPKERVSLQLKDGRVVYGQVIGDFGERTAILADDGKQMEFNRSEILWQKPAPVQK